MASAQSDYILRMIEQLAGALGRLRERLAGGAPVDPEMIREVETYQAELLGPLWPMLRSVDATTAVSLIADDRRARLWIELIEFEADAVRGAGDDARAAAAARRAADLTRALAARTPAS